MPTKELFIVPLPEAVWLEVGRIQKIVEDLFGLTPKMEPHITLVIPNSWSLKQVVFAGDVVRKLVKAGRRYDPIRVVIKGVHHYQDGERNVVGLKVVDESGALRNLQQRCRKLIFGWFLNKPLPPRIPLHVTVADNLTANQATELTKVLGGLGLSIGFSVEEIHWLTKGHKDKAWKAVGSFSVGSHRHTGNTCR